MSIPAPITVLLANRPRLFRELLHHAIKTASADFQVVEATEGIPSTKQVRDAHWLIVDAEMANEATKLAAANPHLRILSLDGRGSRAQLLSRTTATNMQSLAEIPTLSQLIELLSQETSPEALVVNTNQVA